MNQRGRLTLYVLAGLYLLYTGGKLMMDVLHGTAGNFIIELVFGILFLVFGGVLAFRSAKEYWQGDYFYQTGDAEEEEKMPSPEDYEPSVNMIETTGEKTEE